MQQQQAPGAPGVNAKWVSASKSGIGKAIESSSSVAFTISHGILNEIFYPREDIACIRDMEFLVTDGKDFFSEEKRDTDHTIKTTGRGIPCYQITNTCHNKKYQIKKEIICDPCRNTVLQNIEFRQAKNTTLKLFALLAPHLHNEGNNNNGWVGDYKGIKMLFAEHKGLSLAMACSSDFLRCSAGYVGTSDGWTDINAHKDLTAEYAYVNSGNIALTAEIDISASKNFLIAIGFGHNPAEAANHARASLLEGFESSKKGYVKGWKEWLDKLYNLRGKIFRESAAVLRMHEAKMFPGGVIASLSKPWGASKDDSDKGGYHVVWPRDLVETASGFLALKIYDDASRVLNYLMSIQQDDGSWAQNMWLEGTPHWNGIQMDQTALPLVLLDKCYHHKMIDDARMKRYWPGIKKAITYLIKNGPFTQQDRWEEEKGYTPFTLATEIAALLAAADLAEKNNDRELAIFCRETADYWNDNIENWTYVTNTKLAEAYNVEGYYIRINPYYDVYASDLNDATLKLKNHKDGEGEILLNEMICVDALALVRFGLRAADDPRIINTLKLIDAKLKLETPNGDCWYRYTNDGYGEDENGDPYNGTGIGRAWPLLTGERAHYEIAAGNFKRAETLIITMEAFANHNLLSEQIWDKEDIPEKDLFFGKHSGSAMPLTWAHAEYIKSCTSLRNKKVFDMPLQTAERYIKKKVSSLLCLWRFEHPIQQLKKERALRLEVFAEADIHWTEDNWQTTNITHTKDTGINIYIGDIKPSSPDCKQISFTFFWTKGNNWENKNFSVEVEK